MSTYSSQSDIHRITSREREVVVGHYPTPAYQRAVADHSYFDQIGAHLARKESFPIYPAGVEFSEDEAAQPSRRVPGAVKQYHMQHSHSRGSKYGLPPTSTRHFSRDISCLSQEGFEQLQRQHTAKRRGERGSTRSQRSRGSTPTGGYQPSSSTISTRSEHNSFSSNAPPPDYNPCHAASTFFPESHTPSHCSVVTNEDDTYKEGAGPSPPHPFSSWDLHEKKHVAEDTETDDNVWESSGSREASDYGPQAYPLSSTHWNRV